MFDKNDENYKRAKKRAKEIKEFYEHLTTYVVIMSFAFIIDVITGGGWWFYWGVIGWGIGVAIHGVNTFTGFNSADWEERKIR